MSDRTVTSARGAQRASTARRGAPSGRLVVGEYVGQAAGDAAQAVRRAGLRPGLDRSFGCEAELIGLVVAQAPEAGCELVRNGMVTLYVAAPGSAPVDENTDTPNPPGTAPAPALPTQVDVEQVEASSAPARARRPRKPGLVEREAQVFDPPPAPVLPDRGPVDLPAAPVADVPSGDTWGSPDETGAQDGEGLDEGVSEDRCEDEFSREGFVVHLDDVLAGRAGWTPPWRRAYPRGRAVGALGGGLGIRGRLAEHPRLAKAVGAVLAVWVVVGLAAALGGDHGRAPAASGIAGHTRHSAMYPAGMRDRAARPSVRTVRRAARPRRRYTTPQYGVAPRRRPTPRFASGAAARPEGAGARTPSLPRPTPTDSAGAPPRPPAPEQAAGGPFSP